MDSNELSTNTRRSYQTSYNQFKNLTGLSDYEIQSMDGLELSREIDKAFSGLDFSASTKLTRISGTKNFIFETYEKELPSRSKVRKNISKKKSKQSNKIDLDEKEVKTIEKFFTTQYKQAPKNQKLRNLRNLILFKLLAYTGQRIGDILKMKIESAKLQTIHYKQEKTDKEVNIPNPCKTEIDIYCNLTGLNQDDYLFESGLNKYLSYTGALKIISYAGLKAIGKDITPHVFRKYVVTHLKKLGIADQDIMAVTGHSDMRMIGYYTGAGQAPENLQQLLLMKV